MPTGGRLPDGRGDGRTVRLSARSWGVRRVLLSYLRGVNINDTLSAQHMKDIIETDECLTFFDTMNEEEKAEYASILLELHENGRLSSPYGEKVGGEVNLFALRIRKGGNARFFYAYDDGTAVWILNGYEKKTEGIPKRELRRARRLKRKYQL